MILPNLDYEKEAWLRDKFVSGIDEVGRGCLAGPVVAATVILPKQHKPIIGVRDSKKLSSKKREEIYEQILDLALDFGVGLIPASEIDEIGIVSATKKAMFQAIENLSYRPDILLIDAMVLDEVEIEQKSIIRGDESCYSISCASIVAKVFRDRVVSGLDNVHPNYQFSSHKGYGTKLHYEAIQAYGLTSEHRRTFLKNLNSKI